MIIRAASDSDSDSERELERSRFGRAPGGPVFDFSGVQEPAPARAAPARRAWLLASAGVVVLLLADTAALAGALAGAAPPDAFALAPLLLGALFSPEGARAPPVLSASGANYCAALLLAAGWIRSREGAKAASLGIEGAGRAWAWIAALALFGHIATGVYALAALLESDGDRVKFWAGARRSPARAYPGA